MRAENVSKQIIINFPREDPEKYTG